MENVLMCQNEICRGGARSKDCMRCSKPIKAAFQCWATYWPSDSVAYSQTFKGWWISIVEKKFSLQLCRLEGCISEWSRPQSAVWLLPGMSPDSDASRHSGDVVGVQSGAGKTSQKYFIPQGWFSLSYAPLQCSSPGTCAVGVQSHAWDGLPQQTQSGVDPQRVLQHWGKLSM